MNDSNEHHQLHKKFQRKHALYLLLGIVVLGFFFSLTTPSEVSLAFLLVPFLLISFSLYHLFSLLVSRRFRHYKKRFTAVLLSGALTILLVLSSLDQLSLFDVLIALLFLSIALIYVHYIEFFKR